MEGFGQCFVDFAGLMVHVAFEVLTAALELVFFAVDEVFGNFFAIFVDFIVEIYDFFLEDEFCIFVVDWVVLGAYFDFISSDLNNDIGFEHQLDVGELGVVFLLSLVSLVILDVDEEFYISLGRLD